MTKLLTTKDAEIINKPWVKCCVCKLKTYQGIKQTRVYVLDNGLTARMDLYMCMKCMEAGEAWPGIKPHRGMGDQTIQGEFDRFKDNRRIFKG